jgi:hypothetical protein
MKHLSSSSPDKKTAILLQKTSCSAVGVNWYDWAINPALSILQICNAVVIEKRINFAKMNNNNSILLVDPGFDPDTATNCDLLLKVTADSLSYAIVNTGNNRVEVLYDRQNFIHQQAEVGAAIQADPNLQLPFHQVKVCSYTINSIAIPNDFFKEELLDTYRPYFTDLDNYSDDLHTAAVATQPFKTVFLLPRAIEDAINSSWPDAHRFEQSAPFLATPKPEQAHYLLLDFTAGSFYAMLVKDGALIFQNFYQTEDAEEFMYYLMLISRQLHLDPAQTDVLVSGIINSGDPQYQILAKRFRSVNLHTPGFQVLEETILEDMPAHYYTSLLALQLCE